MLVINWDSKTMQQSVLSAKTQAFMALSISAMERLSSSLLQVSLQEYPTKHFNNSLPLYFKCVKILMSLFFCNKHKML